MDPVIRNLLHQRLAPGEGLPVFEDMDSVTSTPPQLRVDEPPKVMPKNALGSTEPLTDMVWLAFPRRAAGLPGTTMTDAFYLKLNDSTKKTLGARAGDFALFTTAASFPKRFAPAEGTSLLCMLESAGRRQLSAMSVVTVQKTEAGGKPQRERGHLVVSGGETSILLRPAAKTKLAGDETVIGVAVRLEHDLA